MSYRAIAAAHGSCGQHSQTPAVTRCQRCKRALCEDCVAYEVMSLCCRPCARAERLWRARSLRRNLICLAVLYGAALFAGSGLSRVIYAVYPPPSMQVVGYLNQSG